MKKILIILAIVLLPLLSFSQNIRTSYFMNSSTARLDMNPAFQPSRGYIKILGLGGLGINFSSNSLSLDKVIYPNPDGSNSSVSILDTRIDGSDFLSSLKSKNKFNFSFNEDIIGFGWFTSRNNFWSFNLGVKSMFNATIPYGIFEFLKEGNSGENGNGKQYNFKNLQASEISYADLSVGYSMNIDKKLKIGLKLKYLIPIADVDMKFDKLELELNNNSWRARGEGSFHAIGMKMGADYKLRDGKETIDELNFDGDNVGVGFGFGFDIGAEYKINDKFEASISILDLGRLFYKKENDIAGSANTNYSFDGINLGDDETFDVDDVISYEKSESEKRSRALPSAFNLGLKYKLYGDKITAGLVYSSRYYPKNTIQEITLSANFHPMSWLYTTLSYSLLESDARTFGLALNINPSWINVFIGSDFMFFKVTPQYAPIKNKVANIFMGISIPLGKNRRV